MAGGIVDVLRHLRALRIVGHIGNQIKCHAGECLDEGLVNGGGYRAGALIGDMRCNWVDFLIEVVFDFRVLDGWRDTVIMSALKLFGMMRRRSRRRNSRRRWLRPCPRTASRGHDWRAGYW